MVEMVPVQSSNVKAVGYDAQSRQLTVQFLSGATYRYHAVSADDAERLMNAPSVGKHLAQHIKGRYVYEQVEIEA